MIKTFEQYKNDIKFFFDMDDVLCDFSGAVSESPEVQSARKNLKEYLLKKYPNFFYPTYSDVKLLIKKVDDRHLENLFFKSKKSILKVAEKRGFFENLQTKIGAKEMLIEAKKISGQLPDILTACIESQWCELEKKIWLDKNLSGFYENFHCTKEKEKFAAPNHILIDDRLSYVKNFKKAGGKTILFTNSSDVINKMRSFSS